MGSTTWLQSRSPRCLNSPSGTKCPPSSVVGLTSVVPPLHDAAVALGLLQIVWFAWRGVSLLTARQLPDDGGGLAVSDVTTPTPKLPPAWFIHTFRRAHRGMYRLSRGRFLWTPASKRGWGAAPDHHRPQDRPEAQRDPRLPRRRPEPCGARDERLGRGSRRMVAQPRGTSRRRHPAGTPGPAPRAGTRRGRRGAPPAVATLDRVDHDLDAYAARRQVETVVLAGDADVGARGRAVARRRRRAGRSRASAAGHAR
jgi:hypothetical protein